MDKLMTNKKIVKKMIEKAVKGGWKNDWSDYMIENSLSQDKDKIFGLIFDHSFAKAFWGEEIVEWHCDGETTKNYKKWEIELRQMVIQADPLIYVERFLDD